MFSSSSVVDGSLPSPAGELHPRLQDSQCHPLILDGSVYLHALRRSSDGLCLHVLSSFQRTGCLARLPLRVSASRSARSPTAIFPSGEPCNLTERSPYRQLFSRLPFDFFFAGAFETAAPSQSHAPPFPVFRALEVRLGSCELKEVFRLRAIAPRRNGSCSGPLNIRCGSGAVNSGRCLNANLDRTRVTDCLTEL